MFGPSKNEIGAYYVAERCSRRFRDSAVSARFFRNIQTLTNLLLSCVYALKENGMFGPVEKKNGAYYVAKRCSRRFRDSAVSARFFRNIQTLTNVLLSCVYAIKENGMFGPVEKKNGAYYVAERCSRRFRDSAVSARFF
jgi:hypothetical protein